MKRMNLWSMVMVAFVVLAFMVGFVLPASAQGWKDDRDNVDHHADHI